MTNKARVEDGDGGRRLINKPVLPSPESAQTQDRTDKDRAEDGDGGRRVINKPVLPSPEPAPT